MRHVLPLVRQEAQRRRMNEQKWRISGANFKVKSDRKSPFQGPDSTSASRGTVSTNKETCCYWALGLIAGQNPVCRPGPSGSPKGWASALFKGNASNFRTAATLANQATCWTSRLKKSLPARYWVPEDPAC